MKLRIKSTLWNIRKRKALNQNSKKKKTKQNGDKQSIRCKVQNTGYQDAQGTH